MPKTAKKPDEKTSTHPVLVRLSKEEHALFRTLGGTPYLRRHLQRVKEGGETVTIRPALLSADERTAFLEGVREAGGLLPSFPFGRSRTKEEITVKGFDPREWGKQWYTAALERGSLF